MIANGWAWPDDRDPRRLTPEVCASYLAALPTPEDREGSGVFPRRIVGSTPWLRRLPPG